MIRHFTISLFLLASLITIAGAQTPPGVNVKLSFAENKTVYRIGEPIKLVMEFTADREGYIVEFHPDGHEPGSDTVVVSPDIGITRWYEEFSDNGPYARHVFSTNKLTATPQAGGNHYQRSIAIRQSGSLHSQRDNTTRFSRFAETNARSSPLIVSTDSLKFEIVSMNEADEAKEVKRLSKLLDAKRDTQNQDIISTQLSYLTGDPSAREKVRRFLNPEQNSSSHIWHGLFIARNRALVAQFARNRLCAIQTFL